MSFDTYMGITDPYDTTWADGRLVTVYPSGKVVERATGYLVQRGRFEDSMIDSQKVNVVNPLLGTPDKTMIYVIIFGIIAVVAIVAVSNGRR